MSTRRPHWVAIVGAMADGRDICETSAAAEMHRELLQVLQMLEAMADGRDICETGEMRGRAETFGRLRCDLE